MWSDQRPSPANVAKWYGVSLPTRISRVRFSPFAPSTHLLAVGWRIFTPPAGVRVPVGALSSIGHRPMEGLRLLMPSIGVRIPVPEPVFECRPTARTRAFDARYGGSSPSTRTKPRKSIWRGRRLVKPCRDGFDSHTRRYVPIVYVARTPGSHPGKRGSTPRRDAKFGRCGTKACNQFRKLACGKT